MKRQTYQEGAIVKIPYDAEHHTYGRLLFNPYIAVYDCRTNSDEFSMEEIVSKETIFTVAVHIDAVKRGRWLKIGHIPLKPNELEIPERYIQDIGNSERFRIINFMGEIRESSREECKNLERAAVWAPEHIENRILDHYEGRPNKWVESLKMK